MWLRYIFSCGHMSDVQPRNPSMKRSTSSIRGNLVRSYQTNIENEYYVDREHELGKGGCGVVVVGEHKLTRTQYAIKIVNKATAERGRLDRELKLMKDVDHANIVRLFSVYEVPQYMYFVMELCLGGHLGNLLSRQPNKCVDEEWAKKLCRQLMSAVAHIHGRGIAHRDIKLQNILIDSTSDRSAQLKLIDFGYGSRYVGALPMKTKCGTPYTTAPEVIRECYDQRCDVWSVGVVLFIMLCGRRPFEAIDVGGPLTDAGKAAMITNILAGRFHFNHKAWANVSRQGINFVKALLTQDYRYRMHSHEALESPWLKDTNTDIQMRVLTSEKSVRALNSLKKSYDQSEFQRTGMVALVFGIPSRAAADLRAVFQSFDVDSSGQLSKKEFHGALAKLAPELSHDDIEKLFDIVDIDKNKQISFTEFLVATLDPREVDIEELNKAFRLLDEDGNGFITKEEMRKVVKQMLQQALENSNENPSDWVQLHSRAGSSGDYLEDEVDNRVDAIFAQVDVNNDGSISYSEFIWAMTGMDPTVINDQTREKRATGPSPIRVRSNSGVKSPSLSRIKEGKDGVDTRRRSTGNEGSMRGGMIAGQSFKTTIATDTDSMQSSNFFAKAAPNMPPIAARQPSMKRALSKTFQASQKPIMEESSHANSSSHAGSSHHRQTSIVHDLETSEKEDDEDEEGEAEDGRENNEGDNAEDSEGSGRSNNTANSGVQFKGILALSQKGVLDEAHHLHHLSHLQHLQTGSEGSPRTSLRLEAVGRGSSSNLAFYTRQDDLEVPPIMAVSSSDGQHSHVTSSEPRANNHMLSEERSGENSSSSYNTQAVANLFGPPSSPLKRYSGTAAIGPLSPLTPSGIPITLSTTSMTNGTPGNSRKNTGNLPASNMLLRSVKETNYEDSGQSLNNNSSSILQGTADASNAARRDSLSYMHTAGEPSGVISPGYNRFGSNLVDHTHDHGEFSANAASSSFSAAVPLRSRQSSQQRISSIIDPNLTAPFRFNDPGSGAPRGDGTMSPGGGSVVTLGPPNGTPKLARLGSRISNSFRRDSSFKYMVEDDDQDHHSRTDPEPVPPALSRHGSRGFALSTRDMNSGSSSKHDLSSGPMTSPSILGNLKRMVSSKGTSNAATVSS